MSANIAKQESKIKAVKALAEFRGDGLRFTGLYVPTFLKILRVGKNTLSFN